MTKLRYGVTVQVGRNLLPLVNSVEAQMHYDQPLKIREHRGVLKGIGNKSSVAALTRAFNWVKHNEARGEIWQRIARQRERMQAQRAAE